MEKREYSVKELLERFKDKKSEWNIEADGTMVHKKNGYYIEGRELESQNWIAHMIHKSWLKPEDFINAFFTACRVRGLNNITLPIPIV